jgi:serine/threonine protein kinase
MTNMLSRSDFQIIKPIREGTNGGNNRGVYLVKLKSTNKPYIEKRVGTTDIKAGYALREIRIMIQCWGHPNIVRIKSHDLNYSTLGNGSIFMQNCELGSLDGLIRRYSAARERLPDEGLLWDVFWEMSLALNFLLTGTHIKTARERAGAGKVISTVSGWNPITHMDIKPANIFMTNEESFGANRTPFPTMVLGDFGCSKSTSDIVAGVARLHRLSGETPEFAPPESPSWNDRGDVYMLGLTIHCLGRMSNLPDVVGHYELSPRYGDENLRKLIKRCIKTDSRERPSAYELPAIVYSGYKAWRNTQGNGVARLPRWALP